MTEKKGVKEEENMIQKEHKSKKEIERMSTETKVQLHRKDRMLKRREKRIKEGEAGMFYPHCGIL